MNTFWTSDYHLNHFNIIRYCGRPFKTVEEMNETIIKKHNERVKADDMIFDLGDFNFKNSIGGKPGEGLPVKPDYFLKQLNGIRIPLKGNHSANNGFKTPIHKIYIRFGGKDICMTHNPKHADPKIELNLVGHVHQVWKVKRLNEKSILVNVGVDVWEFRPVSFDDIMRAVSEFKRSERNGHQQVTDSKEEKTQGSGDIENTTSKELQSAKMGSDSLA